MERFDEPTAVLIFHLNKDHSEVGWNIYRKMVDREFPEMFSAVKVPVELAVQGEDISFLAAANPVIVEVMRSCPKISVLQGLYTHTLPSFFRGTLKSQLSLSNNVLKHYLGEKVSWVGSLPECDVSTPITPFLKEAGWKGVVVLEDLYYTYEYHKETNALIPLAGETVLRSPEGMPLIVSAGAELRKIYHDFYRGFAKVDDFFKALEGRARKSKTNFAVFLTDLEIPQINAIKGKSRTDLWEEFFQAAARSEIRFCHFEDPEVKRFITDTAKQAQETQINMRSMPKWYHSKPLYRRIAKTFQENRSADPRDLCRLTISDAFSAIHYRRGCAVLDVKDSDDKVIVKPDLARRMTAFKYFRMKAEGGMPRLPDEPSLRWYLETLEKAHQEEPP